MCHLDEIERGDGVSLSFSLASRKHIFELNQLYKRNIQLSFVQKTKHHNSWQPKQKAKKAGDYAKNIYQWNENFTREKRVWQNSTLYLKSSRENRSRNRRAVSNNQQLILIYSIVEWFMKYDVSLSLFFSSLNLSRSRARSVVMTFKIFGY